MKLYLGKYIDDPRLLVKFFDSKILLIIFSILFFKTFTLLRNKNDSNFIITICLHKFQNISEIFAMRAKIIIQLHERLLGWSVASDPLPPISTYPLSGAACWWLIELG